MQKFPMNKVVYWNVDEKIIGVVGVAPAATADFYTKIIQLTPAQKDWEHVRVIIDSNPKIPSRGRYLELGEADPIPYIIDSIMNLQKMGASIIAVPCNTLHVLYQRYANNQPVVCINMIEATVELAIQTCGNIPQRAAVFASRLTQKYHLYENVFRKRGGNLLDTSLHQEEISMLIENIKQGKSLSKLKKKMNILFSFYKTADVFIMGCTELSLLIKPSFNEIPIIDSNFALAKACLVLSKNLIFNRSLSK